MSLHPLTSVDPRFGDGVFGLETDPRDALVHLIPVPFEATTSYGGGTASGPEAIRTASAQVDLFDPDLGRPYRTGLFMHPSPKAIVKLNARAKAAAAPVIRVLGEIGNSTKLQRCLDLVNDAGTLVNAWLEEAVEPLLDAGRIVGVVGGDHAIPFGSIRAHARRWPGLGILHFDAHADLRDAYEGFTWSHASIFHNVMSRIPEVGRLVQVSIRDFCDAEWEFIRNSKGRIVAFTDQHLRDERDRGVAFAELARRIVAALPEWVYISFDIDGLDPALCPSTGTPVPGGLSFQEMSSILIELVRSGRRVAGFDLCEVAPDPRGSEWDANVGARVLYKLIATTVATRITALSPS